MVFINFIYDKIDLKGRTIIKFIYYYLKWQKKKLTEKLP